MELSSEVLDDIQSGNLDLRSLRRQALEDQGDHITYIDEPISYEEFFVQHLLPNRPCVLGTWATGAWQSRRDWATADGKPDTEFLNQHFGGTVVPVADCGREEYSAHCKADMTVNDYLQYLHRKNNPADQEERCLYLKDWHFTRAHPEYEAYQTPVYFQSDWLNEFWDGRSDERDDYRFVYCGPKGSWTPFHADVLRSYSWSANICGKKLWWLYQPGQEDNLKDRFGQLAYDLRSSELKDTEKFPKAEQCGSRLEVTQYAGEIIFVPSGWHHQVFNLEDTVSINHNWLNACSVDLSWDYVKASLRDVQWEIDDCRLMDGWHQQCQLILKANNGIDYAEFYRFIRLIATNRLHQLSTGEIPECQSQFEELAPSSGTPKQADCKQLIQEIETHSQNEERHNGQSHLIFDLARIASLLKDMLDTKEFQELDSTFDECPPQKLLEQINSYL